MQQLYHHTRMFGSSASDGFARTMVVVKLRAAMGRTEEPAERSAAPIARLLDIRRLILGDGTELAGVATRVGCLDEANGGGWAWWCCYAIVEVIENSGASIRRGAISPEATDRVSVPRRVHCIQLCRASEPGRLYDHLLPPILAYALRPC